MPTCCGSAQDPDLRALRERREWLDTTGAAVGGVSSRALVSARTELRAPLRLARLWASGGLAAGAGLGLLIITGRIISSLRGALGLRLGSGWGGARAGPGPTKVLSGPSVRPVIQLYARRFAFCARRRVRSGTGSALSEHGPHTPALTCCVFASSCFIRCHSRHPIAAGGEGAPNLTESLNNFAINSAALAALSWVFARDLRSQARDRRVIEREEALARLQVCLPPVRARGAPGKTQSLVSEYADAPEVAPGLSLLLQETTWGRKRRHSSAVLPNGWRLFSMQGQVTAGA